MMALKGYASAPAPLSSIFSPKIPTEDGASEVDFEGVGARGGGFTLLRGVKTSAMFFPDDIEEIRIYVNGVDTGLPTSLRAATIAAKNLSLAGRLEIRHEIGVPIGAGFGTSAAAALTTLLAIYAAADKWMTVREACKIVHEIELQCGTGLNSEAGFLSEGLVLVLEGGGPSRVKVDSIPIPPNSAIIAVAAATAKPKFTRERLAEIEEIGDKKLSEILERPTPENFLKKSREFAEEAGLVTDKVREVFEEIDRLPVIGYAQNMVGEVCHALVRAKNVDVVVSELRETFTDRRVIVSKVRGSIRASAGT